MHLYLKGEFFFAVVMSGFNIYLYFFSAQWGFHPGGWGKPPLDEYNRPLYGDVFGVLPKAGESGVSTPRLSSYICSHPCTQVGEPVDKTPWGELEPEEGLSIHCICLFFITCILFYRGGRVRERRRVRRGGCCRIHTR